MKIAVIADDTAMELDIMRFAKSGHPYGVYWARYDVRRVRRAMNRRARHLAGKVRDPIWQRPLTREEIEYGCRAAIDYFLKHDLAAYIA